MTKSFGFKALALVASLGLAATLVGCNPDEPAKPASPPPIAPAVKTPAKTTDTKGAAPAPVTPAGEGC